MKPYYQDDLVTLWHGDCREIMPSFSNESIDFVFCDPPFGHKNNDDGDLIQRIEAAIPSRRSKFSEFAGTSVAEAGRPIANDGPEANELVKWCFGEFNRLLSPGCCCCCCCGGGPDPQFARWSLWMDEAIGFKQMVVWNKGPMGMGWHYRRSYETVLVGEKPGAACRWFDETNKVENIIRHIPKIIPTKFHHPTPKPVSLAAHFINLHTKPGDTVLDSFSGHSSTLLKQGVLFGVA